MKSTVKKINVFVSYSHKDEEMKDIFMKHLYPLKQSNMIGVWEDRLLNGGDNFNKVIKENLDKAHIIICLISPDYLLSDYCVNIEVRIAYDKQREDKAVVIPIILYPCMWHNTVFKESVILPKDATPINRPDNHEGFYNAALGIQKVVESTSENFNSKDWVTTAMNKYPENTISKNASQDIREVNNCNVLINRLHEKAEEDVFWEVSDIVKDLYKLEQYARHIPYKRVEIFDALCNYVRKRTILNEKIKRAKGKIYELEKVDLSEYYINREWVNLSMEEKKLKRVSYEIQLIFEILFVRLKDIIENYEADFSGSILTNINLSGMTLKKVNFKNSFLQYAKMYSDKNSNVHSYYIECDFTGAYLDGANLANSDLSGSKFDLTKARFTNYYGCKMVNVSFIAADLTCTYFEINQITGNFDYAILDGALLLYPVFGHEKITTFNKTSFNFTAFYYDAKKNNGNVKFDISSDIGCQRILKDVIEINGRISKLEYYGRSLRKESQESTKKKRGSESLLINKISVYNSLINIVKDYIVENAYGEDLSELRNLKDIIL